MTQDKETLREAVARALFDYDYAWTSRKQKPVLDKWWEQWGSNKDGPWFERADAAIATMFERLRTPSEGMCRAGYFADDLYPQHLCDNQRELHRCVSEPRWQAMLDKFQQENSDAD